MANLRHIMCAAGTVLAAICFCGGSATAQNDIRKDNFNFGHQSGYLYSRLDDGYFHERGWWSFETGIQHYYTRQMPHVTNPAWQERWFLQVPGQLEFAPSDNIVLRLNSDVVAEFPRQDKHSWGGNSPRFRTKIRLLNETQRRPALALTVGVTFSSAKPTNIEAGRHNYNDSNGLAGLGTGVADYHLVFNASKHVAKRTWLHAQLGLIPMGVPVDFRSGPSQADQLPYGFGIENRFEAWRLGNQVAGMAGVLKTTTLDHYAVYRLQVGRQFERVLVTANGERGLKQESDDWVAGLWLKFAFQRQRESNEPPCSCPQSP